ncbi:MAG: hypothetical protein PWQ71_10 [Bacteroidota bacterium]|jgi:hypothetical protein|nr:hypothetical protein [Bacteroidota bacterium]
MAQPPLSDSAKISLMTCAPWSGAVYALYGHTAVWVKDDSTHTDVVFNYGFFDSSQPNFIYHFVRGETDYVLGVTSFEDFISEYRSKGVSVWEQPLNLSQGEKQTLWKALYINSLPENRSYRYNFLYDNCATRPRDMVEKYVEGKIIYPKTTDNQTYRNLLHECLHPYPWMEFGIDLIIGAPADRKIDERDKMFLPEYLKRAFEGAIVEKNDTLRYPLVQQTRVILTSNNAAKVSEYSIFTPLNMAFALLLITLLLSIIQINNINNGFLIKVFDTLLFGMVGLGGTIVFFLMYFSEHPATNPNWNFVWLNIISLLIAVLFWIKSAEKVVHIYHFINFAALTLFLFFWWLIPQQLPVASIPISLCLWVRSGVNMWLIRKEKRKQKKYTSAKYLKAGWGQ